MATNPLSERLDRPGPRRLLSLDGGGIRGVVAAEILVRIEEILRAREPGFRSLGDWFDLVGGTSTGSILAAGVALGLPATTLRDFYLERGPAIFRKTIFRRPWHRYDPAPLKRQLGEVLGSDRRMGSDEFRALLLVVSKNVTTGRTWFFSNNPRRPGGEADAGRRLVDLVLASSAAPTYFPPVPLEVAPGVVHEFVDGGMSMFNNPALQLFLEATGPAGGLGWPRGAENLLLVSVGTGYRPPTFPPGEAAGTTLVGWAGHAVETLMEDANVQQNLLLRLLSRTGRRDPLGAELEALGGPADASVPLPTWAPQLTFHRYTTSLSRDRFDELGLPASFDPAELAPLDAVDRVGELAELGRAIAREQVEAGDFDRF